ITRMLTPDIVAGVFGGYEIMDYTSQLLSGRLKGDGSTVGAYAGWQFFDGVRAHLGFGHSWGNYDDSVGSARASIPANRWLGVAGLTGTYRLLPFTFEPSARVYTIWERERAFVDNLETAQPDRSFYAGRASMGGKLTYFWSPSEGIKVAPYAGIY